MQTPCNRVRGGGEDAQQLDLDREIWTGSKYGRSATYGPDGILFCTDRCADRMHGFVTADIIGHSIGGSAVLALSPLTQWNPGQ